MELIGPQKGLPFWMVACRNAFQSCHHQIAQAEFWVPHDDLQAGIFFPTGSLLQDYATGSDDMISSASFAARNSPKAAARLR